MSAVNVVFNCVGATTIFPHLLPLLESEDQKALNEVNKICHTAVRRTWAEQERQALILEAMPDIAQSVISMCDSTDRQVLPYVSKLWKHSVLKVTTLEVCAPFIEGVPRLIYSLNALGHEQQAEQLQAAKDLFYKGLQSEGLTAAQAAALVQGFKLAIVSGLQVLPSDWVLENSSFGESIRRLASVYKTLEGFDVQPDPQEQTRLLQEVIAAFAKEGWTLLFIALLQNGLTRGKDETLLFPSWIKDQLYIFSALKMVIEKCTTSEELGLAMGVVCSCFNGWWRESGVLAIAQQLATNDGISWEQARNILTPVLSLDVGSTMLETVRQGDLKQCFQLFQNCFSEDFYRQAEDITRVFAKQGRYKWATNVVCGMSPLEGRRWIWGKIGHAISKQPDVEKIMCFVNTFLDAYSTEGLRWLTNPSWISRLDNLSQFNIWGVLDDMVKRLAKSERYGLAIAIAKKIPDSDSSDLALTRVVHQWAKRGATLEAMTLARSLSNENIRAFTIGRVWRDYSRQMGIGSADIFLQHMLKHKQYAFTREQLQTLDARERMDLLHILDIINGNLKENYYEFIGPGVQIRQPNRKSYWYAAISPDKASSLFHKLISPAMDQSRSLQDQFLEFVGVDNSIKQLVRMSKKIDKLIPEDEDLFITPFDPRYPT